MPELAVKNIPFIDWHYADDQDRHIMTGTEYPCHYVAAEGHGIIFIFLSSFRNLDELFPPVSNSLAEKLHELNQQGYTMAALTTAVNEGLYKPTEDDYYMEKVGLL